VWGGGKVHTRYWQRNLMERDHLENVDTMDGMILTYRGVDKSLARLGRKQAAATEDSEFHVSHL